MSHFTLWEDVQSYAAAPYIYFEPRKRFVPICNFGRLKRRRSLARCAGIVGSKQR